MRMTVTGLERPDTANFFSFLPPMAGVQGFTQVIASTEQSAFFHCLLDAVMAGFAQALNRPCEQVRIPAMRNYVVRYRGGPGTA